MALSEKGAFELVAPTFTPMDRNGEVDIKPIGQYADFLLGHDIKTAFVNGSTGESLSLTLSERNRVTEAWVRVSQGRIKVITHIGHNCLSEALEMARHAESIRVDAISAMAPTFFRPNSPEELVDYLKLIADAAPNTPFYFYHMPFLTGVNLNVEQVLDLASKRIPTLAGMKYTHHDLAEFGNITAYWGDRLDFYYGSDNLLLPAMAMGAKGAIGTTYNFIPETFNALIEAWALNDLDSARELQFKANGFIDLVVKYGLLTYGKRLMSHLLGADLGEVRPPLPISSESVFGKFMEELNHLESASLLHAAHKSPSRPILFDSLPGSKTSAQSNASDKSS